MKQNFKVFIGSTSKDLKKHRSLVIDALYNLGIESEYMEKPATSASNPAIFSLSRLERCDVYLCILGVRYGTILPDDEHRSIIHREYDRAVELYNKGLIKDIKVYIANPDEASFPIAVIDNLEKLNSLIDKIKIERTCESFTTPEDLSEKINQDFSNLEDALSNRLKIDPYHFPSLPVEYVPRKYRTDNKDLSDVLKEKLIPSSDWKPILLSGPAGAGKTAAVQEVIKALSEKYHHRIIWIDTTNHETFEVHDLISEIINRFEPNATLASEPENREQKARYLLNNAPTIIVIDDVEKLPSEKQKNLTEWIRNNAGKCAVLFVGVGINRRIRVDEREFIDQMTNAEAQQFWNRLVERAQYPEVFKRKSTEDVIENYGTNPFILFNCVFMTVDEQGTWLSVNELLFKRKEVEERIFKRLFKLEKVGKAGQRLLLALSLFSPHGSRKSLAKIAKIKDENQLSQLIENLLSLWLIRPSLYGDKRYTLDKINREYVRKYMNNYKNKSEMEKRFIENFVEYVESHCQSSVADYDAIEEEIKNIFKALGLADEKYDFDSIIRIFNVLGRQHSGFFEIRGDWDDILKYSEMAMNAARELKDKKSLDRFSCFAATVYSKKGDNKKARNLLESLVNNRGETVEKQSYINALHFLGMLEFGENNYDAAKKLLNRELEASKSEQDGEANLLGIANSMHELGRIARKQMEFDKAQKYYERSLEIRKEFKNNDGTPNKGSLKPALHELGLLMQNRGEWEQNKNEDKIKAEEFYNKAWSYYKEAEKIKLELKNESSLAHTYTEEGELKRLQASNSNSEQKRYELYNDARNYLNKSLEIKEKFGDKFHIAFTKNILAKVALDEGKIDEAKQLHEESLKIRTEKHDQAGIASCHYLAGLIAERLGEKNYASQMFQKSLDIWQEKELLLAEYSLMALSRIKALPVS